MLAARGKGQVQALPLHKRVTEDTMAVRAQELPRIVQPCWTRACRGLPCATLK